MSDSDSATSVSLTSGSAPCNRLLSLPLTEEGTDAYWMSAHFYLVNVMHAYGHRARVTQRTCHLSVGIRGMINGHCTCSQAIPVTWSIEIADVSRMLAGTNVWARRSLIDSVFFYLAPVGRRVALVCSSRLACCPSSPPPVWCWQR